MPAPSVWGRRSAKPFRGLLFFPTLQLSLPFHPQASKMIQLKVRWIVSVLSSWLSRLLTSFRRC